MTMIVLAIILPALLYVALSLPVVHNGIREKCENLLSNKLGVEVTIGDLGIRPFNRALLRDVALVNDGDTILIAKRLGTGINIFELLKGEIAFDYAELTGIDIRLRKDSPDAPLNIQPIIDALTKKEKDKEPSKFDIRINTVVVRKSTISYDVASIEHAEPGIFDANHIKISNLRADLNLPKLCNDKYIVNLKRLAFVEQSGLEVTDIHSALKYSKEQIGWENMVIEMPNSRIEPADFKESLSSLGGIATGISDRKVNIGIKPGSHIALADIAPLVPDLVGINSTINFNVDISANRSNVNLNSFNITDNTGDFILTLSNGVVNNPLDSKNLHYKIDDVSLNIGTKLLALLPNNSLKLPKNVKLPQGIKLKGKAEGNLRSGRAKVDANIDNGYMVAQLAYKKNKNNPLSAKFDIKAKDINLKEALGRNDLGTLNGSFNGEATIAGKRSKAHLDGSVTDFSFRGHNYSILSTNIDYKGGAVDGKLSLLDDAGKISLDFDGETTPGKEFFNLSAKIENVDLYELNLTDKYEGYLLNANIDANLKGLLPDRADGVVTISNPSLTSSDGNSLAFNNITIISNASALPRSLQLKSDVINGDITGDFSFSSLLPTLSDIALQALPTLTDTKAVKEIRKKADFGGNDFNFSFTLDNLDNISDFFNLPINAIYPIDIEGNFDATNSQASLILDAPYLRQGNKLIEGTQLSIAVDGNEGFDRVALNTSYPSRDGGMIAMTLALQANNNIVDTDINWKIDRKRDYSGSVTMSTLIDNNDGNINSYTDIHQSTITFNDSSWIVSPALIVTNGLSKISISDFNVSKQNQFVKIEGEVSNDPTDLLKIDVKNLDLAYIFGSLNINKVQLGGSATGLITGTDLLSGTPKLSTDGIHVTDISYNGCVLGEADVLSHWDNDTKAVAIDGTIHQHNGKTAKVECKIFPLSSSLDVVLKANETPVGFMEEYMKAFASEISGLGSGNAHIYGTFADIDLEGDIYVKDMRLKLNFTNTYYSTSDSIKITPGKITLEDITLSDPYGNTARLDGTVCHTYFRDPTFDFTISNVDEMLVYNESATANADWYGKIFVNGGATIKGEPGVVKIDVEATTTAGSTFSFVLSELEIADDYTFLTFRDKDAPKVEEIQLDERMGAVERLRALLNKKVDEQFSDYIIELRVNITPEAEVILVMDPVSGDRIRSHGQGNMRMVYTSADNDLRMFGDYTLERGTYNFTLQDIIIKDFLINSGSQIAFTGDPLAAQLNIEAIYSLNANLSDLDESFLQDKELNRTNVPVHAVLKVKGDIQQPEISFDLAFPTLTSDTYRKVRSIVSTEEMMNQQIIYLLALNRFYTPEYMSTSTKGNELFSVASSTISSQLSNILGHLSDKVSVAPNFRSNQGNFSDMEVDVALSSRLLNNRLLLNGNFGYRDNMMNSNQFIGDFQIEYLLNRSGSIRLKAYNVYNDQNYYLRTAETTQGVGIMFKKDFDNIFSFLQPLKSKKDKSKQDVNSDSYNATTQQQEESQKNVGVQHDRTPFKPESTDSTSSSLDSNATPQLLQFNSKSSDNEYIK